MRALDRAEAVRGLKAIVLGSALGLLMALAARHRT
jgi:hypothetical protein